MPGLFISYRRQDSQDITGRIYDHLVSRFGADHIFLDVDDIPMGVDFRRRLTDAVAKADVLIVVIGRSWLGIAEGRERPRLHDPSDFVAIEVEAALKREIPVVPVLVGGARMPTEAELPASIAELAYRNATEVRSGRDFRATMDALTHGIERILEAEVKPAGREFPGTAGIPTRVVDDDHWVRLAEWGPVTIDLARHPSLKVKLADHECAIEGGTPPSVVDEHGQRWTLWPGKNVVGRDPSCDICIYPQSLSISRKHLIVELVAGGRLRLVDISTVGTFVLRDVLR